MNTQIEEIKRKIDIVEFIGSYINLKKTGRNFKALCPFHQEKTPSFIVSPDRQIWHCFGACSEGGDIFKFLMKWENVTFFEALTSLAKKAGIKLEKIGFEDKEWDKKQKIIEINHFATQFFHYLLRRNRCGINALEYLKKRGVKSNIIDEFQLGYAPNSWRTLTSFLKKRGFSSDLILESGLAIKGVHGLYDRFRGRLIFPIKNIRDQVIGFSGRLLDENIKEAKYINSPETFIYHKRESLFGIDKAKETIRKTNKVFLVEGEFDMISCYQIGLKNVVAVKGTAVTKEQLFLIKRMAERINLFLDADQAGEEAIKKVASEIEMFDFETKVITIDFAKDPDEAIKKDINRFKQIVKKPIPIYDFILNGLLKKYSIKDPFGKKRIAEEMVNYLIEMKNPVIESYYSKKLAEVLDLEIKTIESLKRKMRFLNQKRILTPIVSKKKKEERRVILEKYLLSYLFQSKISFKIFDRLKKIIEKKYFSVPAFQKIWQIFFDFRQLKEDFILDDFVKILPSEIKPVFDELYLFSSHYLVEEKEKIEKVAYEIKKDYLKNEISQRLKNEIDDETIRQLNKELTEVEKTINLL